MLESTNDQTSEYPDGKLSPLVMNICEIREGDDELPDFWIGVDTLFSWRSLSSPLGNTATPKSIHKLLGRNTIRKFHEKHTVTTTAIRQDERM